MGRFYCLLCPQINRRCYTKHRNDTRWAAQQPEHNKWLSNLLKFHIISRVSENPVFPNLHFLKEWQMENVKHKIIAFWLTHVFLRRIGKRYPEYFYKWICELTDDQTTRSIMSLRYIQDPQQKFESIAIELNIPLRRVFEKHKKVINRIISGSDNA